MLLPGARPEAIHVDGGDGVVGARALEVVPGYPAFFSSRVMRPS